MVRVGLAAAFLSTAASVSVAVTVVEVGTLPLHAPAAQPHVVADPARRRFVLSWQQRSADGCTTLSTATVIAPGAAIEPRPVASGCNWFVNWADFPNVAIADNGDWVTFWLERSGDAPYAYDIRMVRSSDDGRTWSAPFSPHDDGTQTEHGFVSMAAVGGDRVLVVWLDGRATAKPDHGASGADGHAAHGHAGAMQLRSAIVRRGGRIEAPALIDERVCSCCPTDLVRHGAAATVVWRDRDPAEIRDIYSATWSQGRWSRTTVVHPDRWYMPACPVNGPALAVQGDRRAVAWPTMQGERLTVAVQYLGEPASRRVLEAGSEVLGRPDIVPWRDGFLALWLGAGPRRSTALKLAWLDARLEPRATLCLAELPPGRGTGMPRLAAFGERALAVWTEPGSAEARIGHIRLAWLEAGAEPEADGPYACPTSAPSPAG